MPLITSPRVLLLLCGVVWVWSAIAPYDAATWRMEQIASLFMVGLLLLLRRTVTFSLPSMLGIAALFCIHTVGTHYTYSLTPYNDWSTALFGSSINDWFQWTRNHYDRFVHLAYGLCLTLPISEALTQKLKLQGGPSHFLSVQLVLSTSALYELMEWSAAIVFGGDVGTAYLGTQGDVWDAQADIALAMAGSLLVVGFLAFSATSLRAVQQHPASEQR